MKEWQRKEEIVSLIESSINPNAVVKHNQWLTDLTANDGEKRQCDTVIYEGLEPRQLISIVEVQDRKAKVSQKDFADWIDKLRCTGANRLICVSKAGFVKRVKEKAQKLGSQVKLITLKHIPNGILPINTTINMHGSSPFLENISNIKMNIPNGDFEPFEFDVVQDRLFKLNGSTESYSLFQIAVLYFNNVLFQREQDKYEMRFPFQNNRLTMNCHNEMVELNLSCDCHFRFKNIALETVILEYNQQGDDTLAWHVYGKAEVNNMPIEAQFILIPNGNDFLAKFSQESFGENVVGVTITQPPNLL